MKRFQSVLCTLVLSISLSSTALAGHVHGGSAPVELNTNGILTSEVDSNGILISEVFAWGDIAGGIVSILGHVHG